MTSGNHVRSTLKSDLGFQKLALGLVVLLFIAVLIRTAWLCDDAYITFRTVDNFVGGYGLTWNVAERVQSFTHPSWTLLLSAGYALSGEIYFTSLALSLAASLAAALLVSAGVVRGPAALLALVTLTLSRAFIDYATSGLENPLTHLLLALFLWVYFARQLDLRRFFWLCLLAGLATLNRMDTLLLFAPALILALWRLRTLKAIPILILGFSPFILWEAFALFYYGFPFPNTAYAKLNLAVPRSQLIEQGLHYLLNALKADPLTPLVIALGLGAPLLSRKRHDWPVALGMTLYLTYVIYIGGDFMSGRFLAAPFLCAVVLLARMPPLASLKVTAPALLAVVVTGFIAPHPTLLSGSDYGVGHTEVVDEHGISDERAFYYPATGLLKRLQDPNTPDYSWIQEGRAARQAGIALAERQSVGFFGFYAGPQVHVLDDMGLGDPLLARLPAPQIENWRIGHPFRYPPPGYLETLASGGNTLRHPALASYYDKLALVTRGELFDPQRWFEIYKLNTGAYDHLLEAYTQADPHTTRSSDVPILTHQRVIFGGKLDLIAFDWEPQIVLPGQPLLLTLYWQAFDPDLPDLTIEPRLLGPTGESLPPDPFWPQPSIATSQWASRTVYVTHYKPVVPLHTPMGLVHLEISVRDAARGDPLPASGPGGQSLGTAPQVGELLIGEASVVESPEIQHPRREVLGGTIALLGYDLSAEADQIDLTLYWQTSERLERDLTVFVHVVDPAGQMVTQQDSQPNGGRYPTSTWEPGAIIRDAYALPLPAPPPPGPYTILVGMYQWPSLERLPVTLDGAAQGDHVALEPMDAQP